MLVVWPSVSALTASHRAWRLKYLQNLIHLAVCTTHAYHSLADRPTVKLYIMEAVQWHLVHIYKHRNRTDHRLLHGNTEPCDPDRPWNIWYHHRNNTNLYCSCYATCVIRFRLTAVVLAAPELIIQLTFWLAADLLYLHKCLKRTTVRHSVSVPATFSLHCLIMQLFTDASTNCSHYAEDNAGGSCESVAD